MNEYEMVKTIELKMLEVMKMIKELDCNCTEKSQERILLLISNAMHEADSLYTYPIKNMYDKTFVN